MYHSYEEIFNQGVSLKKTFDHILSLEDEIKHFIGVFCIVLYTIFFLSAIV